MSSKTQNDNMVKDGRKIFLKVVFA